MDRDVTPHHLGKLLAERQAKTRAAIFRRRARVRLREGLEQSAQLFGCHADAGVTDLESDP